MTNDRQQLGMTGEELATQLLLKKGYRILARNLKLTYGEIDIVALDGQTLVIVEVKAKSNSLYGLSAEMITRAKQLKLRRLAELLAQQFNKIEYRIDVVAVDWQNGPKPTINHYIAAC